jgi:hypothetical protein
VSSAKSFGTRCKLPLPLLPRSLLPPSSPLRPAEPTVATLCCKASWPTSRCSGDYAPRLKQAPRGGDPSEPGTHPLRAIQNLEAVFQVIAPATPERFPPLHALPGHPTKLPVSPRSCSSRSSAVPASWTVRSMTSAASARPIAIRQKESVPDFVPHRLLRAAETAAGVAEEPPLARRFCAYNVVVAARDGQPTF